MTRSDEQRITVLEKKVDVLERALQLLISTVAPTSKWLDSKMEEINDSK